MKEIQDEADGVVTRYTKKGLTGALADLTGAVASHNADPSQARVVTAVRAARKTNSWLKFVHLTDEGYRDDKHRLVADRGKLTVVTGRELDTDA